MASSTRRRSSPSRNSTAGWYRRRRWRSTLHRHGLRLQRVLAAAVARDRRRQAARLPRSYGLLQALVTTAATGRSPTSAGCSRCSSSSWAVAAAIWGGWLERAGPRKAGVVAAFCWSGGLLISAAGVYRRTSSGSVARHRRDRRHRARAGLHLAGLDADQMVSRPARHGDRHGDHGLRRRRDDRRAAGQHPDERIPRRRPRWASGRPSWCWARSISCS